MVTITNKNTYAKPHHPTHLLTVEFITDSVPGPWHNPLDLAQWIAQQSYVKTVTCHSHDDHKLIWLKAYGFVIGDRDPKINTNFSGNYMVSEQYGPDEVPTKDGRNGPWCVVGNDLKILIDAAYGAFKGVYEEPEVINHAFDFAFEVKSFDVDGGDVTANMLREACIRRITSLSDAEIMEACGKYD